MFKVTKKSIQWGEETLTLETGKVARQADGSVIATMGETSVMANVTFAKEQKPGQDFFPLTVHYQERYYAAGKVPGGFFKREARPSEKETLTSRLIDRPIRPLFVDGFKNEVLVIVTVLSHDLVNERTAGSLFSIEGVSASSNVRRLCTRYEVKNSITKSLLNIRNARKMYASFHATPASTHARGYSNGKKMSWK